MGRDPDPTVHRWLTTASGSRPEQEFPSPLIVTLTRYDTEALSLVAGEVDHFSAPVLAGRLQEALDAGVERAVVDISGMAFIDGTGLGVLVQATRRFRARSGDLVLVGARASFSQLVEILDLGRVLNLGSRERARDR